MKLTLVILALTVSTTNAYFNNLFGGSTSSSANTGILYNTGTGCFVKIDGSFTTYSDYGISNPNVNPGLVCEGNVCNVGKNDGALGLPLAQGSDNNSKTLFTPNIKIECPDTSRYAFQFSCPSFTQTVSIESLTCSYSGGDCSASTSKSIVGGSVGISDNLGGGNNKVLLQVKLICTSP
jgi:hypothetical protein